MLAWGGNAWQLIEFGIAIGARLAVGSIALVGFGADSLIEGMVGFVVVWLFNGSGLHSSSAERRAQQLGAASYIVLAVYVTAESVGTLVNGHHPGTSWMGSAWPRSLHRRCCCWRGPSGRWAVKSTRPQPVVRRASTSSSPTGLAQWWPACSWLRRCRS